MDHDAIDRCTQFPDLSPQSQLNPHAEGVTWEHEVKPLPLEILVLSWATLVHSFTGDPNPVFYVDNEAIKVDLTRWTFGKTKVETLDHGVDRSTGIDVHDVCCSYSNTWSSLTCS